MNNHGHILDYALFVLYITGAARNVQKTCRIHIIDGNGGKKVFGESARRQRRLQETRLDFCQRQTPLHGPGSRPGNGHR